MPVGIVKIPFKFGTTSASASDIGSEGRYLRTVVGLDGAPGGAWAAISLRGDSLDVSKITGLHEFFIRNSEYEVIAIDTPIGLMDQYEIGGRSCDKAARAILGKRGSSVFPAPVRPVLAALTYPDACDLSRSCGEHGKAITQQTYNIIPKIKEVDDLLQRCPELRSVVREVHPELSFHELIGSPLLYSKRKRAGKEERRSALRREFSNFDSIEAKGRACGLPYEDIIDAAVACWSAIRISEGKARSIGEPKSVDSTGLKMMIWI